MSEHLLRVEARAFPTRAAMPWLVAVGIYVLLLAFGARLLNDPDTYWHIAVGRWITENHAVPTTDPFSFTMHGAHWIAFEWLSELLYAAVFALAGWTGVVILAAAAIAVAFGLLTRLLSRELAPVPTLLLVLAALALAAPHMLARPHVLVLPIMVAWGGALVRTMDERGKPPYAALPLLIFWANLHGSVVLGLGLIGPAVLEALLNEPSRHAWPRVILRWIPFAALAVLASCSTPYGPSSLLAPLTTLGLGDALKTIVEWRPQDFSHFGVFELLLLASIFALSRGLTLPLVRTLVVLGLLHFALAQTRNTDLLAMLAPLYLAAALARQLPGNKPAFAGAPASQGMIAAAVAAIATGVAFAHPPLPNARNTPQAAIAATELAKAGPVLNDYAFGGYLIYSGIAPFIDGRGELYGGDFINRYNRAVSLSDLPEFVKLLDRYDIRATLLSPRTPAVALLDRMPGWKRVYSDDVAVVHKRRGNSPMR
ncbi:MAG TPA: hypothetical protein VFX37_15450 [Pseudolabrys sp.]|nr:hypothetical protein [Pseudolabrys sp.]